MAEIIFLTLEEVLLAVAFLFMNGWELVDPDETLHPVMEDVAQGKIDKPALADIFEKLAKELKSG